VKIRNLALPLALAVAVAAAAPSDYFVVKVTDDVTGRGVPLIELKLSQQVKYYTDSAGIAAIHEPSFEGRESFIAVSGHGYECHRNCDTPLGRGINVVVKAGGRAAIRVHRAMIAERLYRLTGEGIYRDSALAGLPVPIREPLMNNGQVLGQDTAVAVPYGGKIFWIWGDTILPAGFIGSVTAATSELPGSGGLDPSVGVNYSYFTDSSGLAKPMLPLKRDGLVWIEGLFTVNDPTGRERLLATYTRQAGLKPASECGVATYEDARRQFVPWFQYACLKESHTSSHPVRFRDGAREYWYLYPWLRVENRWDAVRDAAHWERREIKLPPNINGISSIAWNEYRERFVAIFDKEGKVWYAEADRPEGPYGTPVEIIHHDHYNFYNTLLHPFFDQEGGRVIYLEGTYTQAFSDAKEVTPRYDYNQVMYRLQLNDPRLKPAQVPKQ
jgi:hypothetical protein